jgi:hypothetical protein
MPSVPVARPCAPPVGVNKYHVETSLHHLDKKYTIVVRGSYGAEITVIERRGERSGGVVVVPRVVLSAEDHAKARGILAGI